jgi:hypothetical protein
MADYPGVVRDDGADRSASSADMKPGTYHVQVIAAPGAVQYFMRGLRPGTLDYETWTAVGTPNTSNPSGQPIVEITSQSSWSSD